MNSYPTTEEFIEFCKTMNISMLDRFIYININYRISNFCLVTINGIKYSQLEKIKNFLKAEDIRVVSLKSIPEYMCKSWEDRKQECLYLSIGYESDEEYI